MTRASDVPGLDLAESAHARARIGDHVLRALAPPGEPRGVLVLPLWERAYRVNVLLVGPGASVAGVHSYFLVADAAGKVIGATRGVNHAR